MVKFFLITYLVFYESFLGRFVSLSYNVCGIDNRVSLDWIVSELKKRPSRLKFKLISDC